MMSLDNNIGAKPGSSKDEIRPSGGGGGGSSGGKKSSSSMKSPEQGGGGGAPPALKCPRCDSANTKFCYYNNYSLTQPRHFCKTCRRYWTKGGALRNVPIGGGCRKSKKMKSSNSSNSSSRFSGDNSSSSCSDIGGLKFFSGLSPAMDFQLGGLNLPPRPTSNQFSLFGGPSSTCFNLDPLGFNNGFCTAGGGGLIQEMGNANIAQTSSLASSIESLSCINQDLHWKLQQQRLAMLFGTGGGENQQKESIQVLDHENDHQGQRLLQPILFQNLEISSKAHEPIDDSRKEVGGGGGGGVDAGNHLATEWFFDNCYTPVNVDPTPTTSNSAGNDQNGSNNWNGIQAWTNLNQYSAIP